MKLRPLMIRPYLTFLLSLTLSLGCGQRSEQPNVLMIMVDDMAFGDVSRAGNPYIQTPHLDQLSAHSVTFDRFYVSPVCAPTRASVLTGRYHQRTGVHSVTNGYETLDPEEVTLAESLQQVGYRTGLFGKWHLGEYYPSTPSEQGFDHFVGFLTGHHDHYFNPTLLVDHTGHRFSGHITDILTNEALTFMVSSNDQPFFCFLSYNAPHTPLQVDSLWFKPYLDLGLNERDARVYGMVAQLDDRIGFLIQSLDSATLLEETIVIFLSDNGPISGWKIPQEEMRYNAGLRDQKFTVYEGGIRTQCYWMWKDHWKPHINKNQLAAHVDIVPTLLQLLKSTKDTLEFDGIDLLPLLQGETQQIERSFFQHFSLETLGTKSMIPGSAYFEGPWKLLDSALYHLDEDEDESQDVRSRYPGVYSNLRARASKIWAGLASSDDFVPDPILLGASQAAWVRLQPHHAQVEGNLQYVGKRGLTGERIGIHPRGVDGDWLIGWKELTDLAKWMVRSERAQPQNIEVSLRSSHTGSFKWEIWIGKMRYQGTGKMRASDDWQDISLCEVQIPKGIHEIKFALTPEKRIYQIEVSELCFEE